MWSLLPSVPSNPQFMLLAAGTKLAVVSNFDLRLRPLLEALGIDQLFDALIISAEVHCLLHYGSCLTTMHNARLDCCVLQIPYATHNVLMNCCSAQVEAEKPNPVIFEAALKALGVNPVEAVHVGDDRRSVSQSWQTLLEWSCCMRIAFIHHMSATASC